MHAASLYCGNNALAHLKSVNRSKALNISHVENVFLCSKAEASFELTIVIKESEVVL